MRLHPEELSLARIYTQITPFEGLAVEQEAAIKERGRALRVWFQNHFYVHCAVSFGVIIFLLAADFVLLLRLPSLLLERGSDHPWSHILLSGLIVGSLRGWLMYSLVEYSLHEGAAHKIIFPPRGAISRCLHELATNLSRLGGADPVDFAKNHGTHHAYFGTERDGEFLNFVLPSRYWKTLIPFSMFLDLSDFITHRAVVHSRSRLLSDVVLVFYNVPYLYLMARAWGPAFALFTVAVVSSHVAFGLDRLRQFSEHNLMPIENQNGARSFGPGFWGLVVGGGPWGQPCHWIHHMVPNLPWYQQIILHGYVVGLLTPRQRKQFLLQPVLGYPKLLWRLWTEPYLFIRKVAALGGPAGL
jgi:hypothetical protein